jgi:hypothetical protein
LQDHVFTWQYTYVYSTSEKSVWINQITTAQHRRLIAMSAEPTTIAVVDGGMAALIWVQQLREQLADSTHAAQLLVHSPTRPA